MCIRLSVTNFVCVASVYVHREVVAHMSLCGASVYMYVHREVVVHMSLCVASVYVHREVACLFASLWNLIVVVGYIMF